jgi:Zn-dependent protease
MSRFLNPSFVIAAGGPVPVTIGAGGLLPVLAFAGLFVEIAARTGVSLPTAAAVGAVGGTASLVAHELGHAFAARRLRGVRPLGVTLIWLGAATKFEGAYERGQDQTKVALAGPAASFTVALALAPVLVLPLPHQARYLVGTLAFLNVALGAMSLIPANPLDGYKALIGLLWSGLGSEGAARRLIRRVALAWLPFELVGTGVLLLQHPFVGTLAFVTVASLFAQKLYVRRAPA